MNEIIMFIFVAGGFIIVYRYLKNAGEKARLIGQKARIAYDEALENLAKNPTEPSARQKCLETGRVVYSILIPDTQTVDGQGRVVASQNNSANREARIQSDIEARIGHLKIAS